MFIRVGSQVINLSKVDYIELHGHGGPVTLYYPGINGHDSDPSLTFSGENAEMLRCFFLNTAVNVETATAEDVKGHML